MSTNDFIFVYKLHNAYIMNSALKIESQKTRYMLC